MTKAILQSQCSKERQITLLGLKNKQPIIIMANDMS